MVKNEQTTKLGTLGHNDRVYVEWLDPDTGERGKDWFRLDCLIELGYGAMRMCDLVVMVRTVRVQ